MKTKETMINMQEELRESAHKIWLAGLGAVSTAGEKGSTWFQQLVEKGEGLESRGKKNVDRAMDDLEASAKKARKRVENTVDDLWERLDERLTETMHRFGVPTRDEIQALTRRVEELNRKVDELRGKPAPPRKVYHVASHEDGWKVEPEGAGGIVSVHGTKDEAVTAARELAHGQVPSQVIVHKKDGKFQTEYTYDAN